MGDSKKEEGKVIDLEEARQARLRREEDYTLALALLHQVGSMRKLYRLRRCLRCLKEGNLSEEVRRLMNEEVIELYARLSTAERMSIVDTAGIWEAIAYQMVEEREEKEEEKKEKLGKK